MTQKSHPHEDHVLDFIKKIQTREYCKTFAKWAEKEYPGSAAVLLPALRDRWRKLD